MAQRFEVTVKGRPHQYTIGEKYHMVFGSPEWQEAGKHCPYLFLCLDFKPRADGFWDYRGVGDFDDNVWKIINEAMRTTCPNSDNLEGKYDA